MAGWPHCRNNEMQWDYKMLGVLRLLQRERILFYEACGSSKTLEMPLCMQALTELFKPILHTLLLVWQHSKYWNVAPRLVAVMREICNDLIMQACKFIPGGGWFPAILHTWWQGPLGVSTFWEALHRG